MSGSGYVARQEIGLRVKNIRLSRDLSLRSFANYAGVSFNALKRFEDGGSINSQTMLKILDEADIALEHCAHLWQSRCVHCGVVRETGRSPETGTGKGTG